VQVPVDFIEEAVSSHRDRTFSVSFAGRKLWIKRPRYSPGPVWHALHSAAAAAVGLTLFRPAPVLLGAAGLRAEARRLMALRAKSWPVPDVVDACDRWLVLTDNGETLASSLPRTRSTEERHKLLAAALAFLQELHSRGAWHGAAQVRNICVRPNGFSLIDFEDDIEPVMPIAARQARDLLQFLMSGARYVQDRVSVIPDLFGRAYYSAAADVQKELLAAAGLFRLANRVLRPVSNQVGRDGKAIYAVACAYDQVLCGRAPARIECQPLWQRD
jgi:hypothetical protein